MAETIYETIKDSDGVECFIKRGNFVRCKYCKHYFNGCCYSVVSNRINFTVEVPDDWFCGDGERREDDA